MSKNNKIENIVCILISLLLLFTIILPIAIIILNSQGYVLGVTSDLVFTLLISLISFSLLYIGTNYKDALENKIIAGVLSLAFMASLIIYSCYILDANSI